MSELEHDIGQPEAGAERPELKLEGRSWDLPSDTVVLAQVRDEVEGRLVAAGWEEPDVSTVLTAVDEAVTNAIVHGNLGIGSESSYPNHNEYRDAVAAAAKGEFAQRRVHITVDIDHDRLNFSVRDEGKGFDVSKLPDPHDANKFMKVSGRGMSVMQQAFDVVGYNDAGNQVWLEKRRPVSTT